MNTQLLRRARELWSNPLAPKEINRANLRKWIRAKRTLGPNWLLAQPVERKE
jgi:hypothetical protein